ncbi:MAG TPA: sigma-70 family RNA polymerase sigma factor [Acidimicrobiia bacterium]|nr:sigma-70 family RNA polymerase sigma factor [Acidimicrobiia bacterium]
MRRILAEQTHLDPLRLAEAQLMATEAVAHFVESGGSDLQIKIEAGPADWRIELASVDDPATPELSPLSLQLISSLSQRWGDDRNEGRRLIWFHVRAPGTGAVLADIESSDLLARAAEDPLYQEEVVRRFGPFSASIARRFRGKGVADADLEQVALLGLVAAMHRFDVEKGDFEPFAAVTIAGELKRHLRDRAWSVRVPRALQESTLNVGKTSDRLTQQLGRQPSAAEIAAELGMSSEEVLQAQKARVAYRWESIDAPDPVTGASTADSLASDDDGVMSSWPELAEELALLPTREQEIVYLRFFEDLTQAEIADRVGISQMHVSRLLARALERLRSVVKEDTDA